MTDTINSLLGAIHPSLHVSHLFVRKAAHFCEFAMLALVLCFAVRSVTRKNDAKKNNYFVMITSDHGNADEMKMENGEPHLAHTINPVFCVVANSGFEMKKHGGLQDVAPTFVELLGVGQNKYFEGKSLILK